MPNTNSLKKEVKVHGRMLRLPEVISVTGLSRTTIWRQVKAGEFPAPRHLTKSAIGWPEELVADWLASRPQVAWAE